MKETKLKKFKMAYTRWCIKDGGYCNIKDVTVTSLLFLMITNLLSNTIILSNMLLLRVCGYKSNRYENILIKSLFSQ